MAIITEQLQLNKQFLIIDSPVPFTLIANNGTDEVYRMAGAWQIDTHKLLPERYQKQYPVYYLDLVYDDTNLGGQSVTVRESNIDIGDGISGVNGQDVKITNFSDMPTVTLPENYKVTNELDNNANRIPLDVNITNNFFLAENLIFDLDSNKKQQFEEVLSRIKKEQGWGYNLLTNKNVLFFNFTDNDLQIENIKEWYLGNDGNFYYYYNSNRTNKGKFLYLDYQSDTTIKVYSLQNNTNTITNTTISLPNKLFTGSYAGNIIYLNF
jgi:hypothetical protein